MRGALLGLIVLSVSGGWAWWPSRGDAPGAKGWQPDPGRLTELERKRVPWVFRESGVPRYELPDPLAVEGGARIDSVAAWERTGRPATLELFRDQVHGRAPSDPGKVSFEVTSTDPGALGGRATLRRVAITASDGARSFRFGAAVLAPNGVRGRVPAFLLINNRGEASADPSRKVQDGFWPAEAIVGRGYATAVFRTVDVDPDADGDAARAKGVRGVWPAGGGALGDDAWATISAWAWGAGRVLDYLRTDPAVDPARVAVVGHSRGGKTALWAGAQDERFALAVSNDSGCGGAALSRRRFGETVARINKGFPYWFCERFKSYDDREDDLPIDQHQLIALMAPRAVYVASADGDFWADQRGEFLSLAHAAPVFALYGLETPKPDEMPPLEQPLVRGKTGYHIRRGDHNLTPYDWQRFMDFADRLWPDRPR